MVATASERREKQRAEVQSELIAAAHDLIREEGYEGLTIRKLAARVGYAPMSVYSYFPDKHAIMFALAQDAFDILARRMERNSPSDPLQALYKLMRDYAAFGLESPNEYRTVFMTHDPSHIPGVDPHEIHKQNPALQLLIKRVQACVDAGVFMGDAFAIATFIWTFGHGTVSLLISFPDFPFGDRQAYVERSIGIVMAGLRQGTIQPLGEEHC